jgi:hypothetical protein
MAGNIWCNFFTGKMRAAAVAFDRYGKDIHANVAQRARHDCGAPEGSQNC